MVATVRNWSHDLNYAIVGATLTLQYQDSIFRLKQFFLARGWSVTRSCDSAAAGAAGDGVDRWVTSANIVPNTSGSAHSWIILQSHAGASRIFIIIDCIDTVPASPNDFTLVIAGSDFATGGTTSARPTSALETTAFATVSWLSSTSVVPRRLHMWGTDVGDVYVAGVTDGQGSPFSGLMFTRLSNGESNLAQPWFCYRASSTTNPGGGFAGTSSFLYALASWRTLALGGAPVNAAGLLLSAASHMASWVAGVSNANTVIADMVGDGVVESASLGAYVGRFIDVRMCGNQTPSGTSQAPQDPDAIVRKSCGGIWLPTPTGTVLQF